MWECKYHAVWIAKYRRKALYGQIRKELGEVFRESARQKEYSTLEGHLMPDHVPVLLSIPPKDAVAQVGGFIKGKVNPHRPKLRWPDEELYRPELLGQRVLRFDGWSG
jgi:putative transposase